MARQRPEGAANRFDGQFIPHGSASLNGLAWCRCYNRLLVPDAPLNVAFADALVANTFTGAAATEYRRWGDPALTKTLSAVVVAVGTALCYETDDGGGCCTWDVYRPNGQLEFDLAGDPDMRQAYRYVKMSEDAALS